MFNRGRVQTLLQLQRGHRWARPNARPGARRGEEMDSLLPSIPSTCWRCAWPGLDPAEASSSMSPTRRDGGRRFSRWQTGHGVRWASDGPEQCGKSHLGKKHSAKLLSALSSTPCRLCDISLKCWRYQGSQGSLELREEAAPAPGTVQTDGKGCHGYPGKQVLQHSSILQLQDLLTCHSSNCWEQE